MICIPEQLYNKFIEYAKSGAPEEVCGLIGGTEAGGVKYAREVYFLENIVHSETRFFVDPAEQFAAIRDMRGKGISPIGCFHSHPRSEAKPSEEDLRVAWDEKISYIIISLKNEAFIKAFCIIGGNLAEEDIVVR